MRPSRPQKRYTSFAEVKTELEHFIATTTLINEYPYLYLLDKERSRILFPLTKERYYLGRSFGNDIVIQNPYISRVHAILEIFEHEVKITNYSRENPIQINQKALNYREFRLLSKNDLFKLLIIPLSMSPAKRKRTKSPKKPINTTPSEPMSYL
jgi:hypothetical protein